MHQNRKNRRQSRSIFFVAACNGSHACNIPIIDVINAYIFQVGYHEEYGLTGALPDDHHGNPQGYRRGDTEIAEFFRMIGPVLRPTFFLDREFVPRGSAEKPKDWFPTPRAAHRRFSDPCLVDIVRSEFEKACKVWDAHGLLLPGTMICHSAGTQWCGDALEIIQSSSNRCIHLVLLFAPAMSYEQFIKFHAESSKAIRIS